MLFDDFSITMICGSFILAPVATIIVGSQNLEDAKSIADWSFGILLLLLSVDCLRFVSGRAEHPSGGLGLVILLFALIAAVGLGYRVASSRASRLGGRGNEVKPSPSDDELA